MTNAHDAACFVIADARIRNTGTNIGSPGGRLCFKREHKRNTFQRLKIFDMMKQAALPDPVYHIIPGRRQERRPTATGD